MIHIVANCLPSIAMVFGGWMVIGGNPSGWWLIAIAGILQVMWLKRRR